MSKKRRKDKQGTKSRPIALEHSKSSVVTPTPLQAADSSPLIVFDNKTKLFLLILLITYFALSLLKVHTSSIANWDVMFGKPKPESVLLGTPKFIRMDEWMVGTPAILSQYALGLPVRNDTLGGSTIPVVWGLPVKDVSTILRPVLWPYFIFDLERAFAFAWNFNIFIFLISTFLMLMLLTRNTFWLSICCSFFIFFSGAVQWWSYSIASYMLYLNGIFISLIYILYSKKGWPLILAGVALLLSAHGFIFNLYPPFQVPLAHLYLAIFLGYVLTQRDLLNIKRDILAKAIVVIAVLVLFTLSAYHYYLLVRNAYDLMLNTSYPGRRFSTGGDLLSGKLFVEFFGIFMSNTHFPQKWGNICEISGFIMFFPIVFYGMIYDYLKTKTIDPLLVCLSVFIVVGLVYLLRGFPVLLSRITLLSMSPARRFLPILGAGNCILLTCYLSTKSTKTRTGNFSWVEFGILATAIIIFVRLVSARINSATQNFFSPTQINIVTLLIATCYLLIRYRHYRFATPALCALLMAIALSNAMVNPLTVGLSSILDNPLLKITRQIHKQDPQARWAVFGDTRITNLLRAGGMNLVNGVKLLPVFNDMAVLDPKGDYYSVYNRYAWVTMNPYIDGKDGVTMGHKFEDAYTISMDPCSPRLKELAVKYLVFTKPDTSTTSATSATFTPRAQDVRCLSKVAETSGIFVYKRNDQ